MPSKPKTTTAAATAGTPEFAIESGVEIPKRQYNGGKPRINYPFGQMKAGDSFVVKCEEADAKKRKAAVGTSARRDGFKITSQYRAEDKGIRVWMIGPREPKANAAS